MRDGRLPHAYSIPLFFFLLLLLLLLRASLNKHQRRKRKRSKSDDDDDVEEEEEEEECLRRKISFDGLHPRRRCQPARTGAGRPTVPLLVFPLSFGWKRAKHRLTYGSTSTPPTLILCAACLSRVRRLQNASAAAAATVKTLSRFEQRGALDSGVVFVADNVNTFSLSFLPVPFSPYSFLPPLLKSYARAGADGVVFG